MYRAYHPEQDRLVAVKLFRLDMPPERTHQFVAELEKLIAADLSHPAIAASLATGISDVSAYLAQDFVAADSLDMVVRNSSQTDLADVVRVATQLGGALDLAAAIGVTHGALHPRDILMSADDVRITGLGITNALEKVGMAAPIRRPYTAPERAAGQPWDRRADVFSMAVLLFELLWRRRLSGSGDQAVDGIGDIPGANTRALKKAIARALAEDPRDRFATAGDFAKAIQAAIEPRRTHPPMPAFAARVRPAEPIPADSTAFAPVPVEELPLLTNAMLESDEEGPAPAGYSAPQEGPAEGGHPAPLEGPAKADRHHARSDGRANAERHYVHPIEDEPLDHLDLNRAAVRVGPSQLDDEDELAAAGSPSARAELALSTSAREPDDLEIKKHQPEFDAAEEFEPAAAESAPPMFAASRGDEDARPKSNVWPLMLALVVGVALGFGAAILLLGRDRLPAPADTASASTAPRPAPLDVRDEPIREFTERAVTPANPPATAANPADRLRTDSAKAPSGSSGQGAASHTSGANAGGQGIGRPAAAPPTKPAASNSRELSAAARRSTTADQPSASVKAPIVAKAKAVPPKTAPPTARSTGASASARLPSKATTAKAAPAANTTAAKTTAAKTTAAKTASAPAEAAAKAGPGSLAVDSRPSGASVFLDGKLIGTTPLVISTVNVGEHAIHLDRDGYQRWATSVRILAGERSRVAASLER